MIGNKLALGLGAFVAAGLLSIGTASAAGAIWDSLVAAPGSSATVPGEQWITTAPVGSSYAEWDFFNTYPTDSLPDIAGVGSITETTGTAFIPGSGNIYSFAAATAFTATLTGGGSGLVDVWLRIGTQGTAAATSATLNGATATRVETYTLALGGMGGDEKEWYWKWTTAAAPTYTFAFGASGSSMSLDQVALYAMAAAVPEPETYALLLAGLGMVGVMVRRRLST